MYTNKFKFLVFIILINKMMKQAEGMMAQAPVSHDVDIDLIIDKLLEGRGYGIDL
jgi:hypothetical protein